MICKISLTLVLFVTIFSCGESLENKKQSFDDLETESFLIRNELTTIKNKLEEYQANVLKQIDPSIQNEASTLLAKKMRELKLESTPRI